MPQKKICGHGKSGVGSLKGFKMCHYAYIFDLYLDNEALIGYLKELERKIGIHTSVSTIIRWFKSIDPFKSNVCVVGTFPQGRDIPVTTDMFCRFVNFVTHIGDHDWAVFANETPMKELMIFRKAKRNIVDGSILLHMTNVNFKKNRYNILCAVTIKGNGEQPVECVIPK